jgi:PAS domain S-box-containing protein
VRMLVDSFNQMAEDIERTTVSKDYMDNIISSMMDTLIVVSLDNKIVRLNDAACFLLGYEEAELQGQPIERVIFGEPGTEHSVLTEVFEKGSISTIEKQYVTKSGAQVPVLFSASVMRDAGNAVQGVVCVAQDITDRKRAEAQLKAYSDELQEINEELKSFAYIVSHDLRAPLVNIRGFSEELILGIKEIGPLLEKYLDGFDAEERKKFSEVLKKDIPEALTFIGSSVNRMDNLISAFLKLSRVGRRKLNPEPISMNELVHSVLNSLAHQIESRLIRVTTQELPDVVGDRMALEQIFGNLIDNAVKYLDPDRAGEIEISAEQRDSEPVFHVRDNGRGMAQDDIPKAFEIFRRVGKQDVPGEGMGLAHVKTLVRMHGGRIWCESEPGVGTTFSFTLPQPEQVAEALPGTGATS